MQVKFDEVKKIADQKEQTKAVGNPSGKFVPDINNKERNLACQFLDHTLAGRDFLKLDLRELTDLTKIGEGAAAVVY